MDYADNTNVIFLTLAGLKQMNAQNFDTVYELESSPRLTTFERNHINTFKLTLQNTQRLYNILAYLIGFDKSVNIQKIDTYEIKPMMKVFLTEFERVASSCTSLSIRFISRLKDTDCIALNKISFEFVMLNLLYCCIKPVPDKRRNPIKITVSVSETQDFVVFHIYDNNRHFNPNDIYAFSEDLTVAFTEASDASPSSLTELSLRVAQKSTEDMNGKFTFSELKSCNRYDIYLPKAVEILPNRMQSPVRYIPTYEYFHEILADIRLEQHLECTGKSSENKFDGAEML